MNQSYLKAAESGPNGSGKSGTAVRLAVGLSKEYCDGAPVVAYDSEERYRFYKPVIFDVEKIPLIIVSGKSLVTLREAQERAKSEGAGVFIGDQLTTPWMEGIRAFGFGNGMLPFDRRQQLMNEWEPVIDNFRYGKFHAICCGRLGYWWSNVEDDQGNEQLHQGDTKFNAGGGSNFGYEADLELELRRRKRSILGLFRGKTSVEHLCDVIKDAASGILNGQQFTWPSTQGLYKAGDYRAVLDSFRPYIEFMRTVPMVEPSRDSSRDLVVSGKTDWGRDQDKRAKLLQEYDFCLEKSFPSGEGKSKLAKMFVNLTTEMLTGSVSRTFMEDLPTVKLEHCRNVAAAIRVRVEAGQIPTDENSLREFVHLAEDDVLHHGKNATLLEVMGRKSVESINRERKELAGD